MKKIFAYLAIHIFFVACAHQEPRDLSLLNAEALDLARKFSSENVNTNTGPRSISNLSSGNSCSVCAH